MRSLSCGASSFPSSRVQPRHLTRRAGTTREGLTIAERELCTFCYIAAQGGCEAQLRAHTAANVQCGNDRAFLIKVVSNNVPFIGYPRSLNAMAVVDEVTAPKE